MGEWGRMEGEKLLEASMYLVFWFCFDLWLFYLYKYKAIRNGGFPC